MQLKIGYKIEWVYVSRLFYIFFQKLGGKKKVTDAMFQFLTYTSSIIDERARQDIINFCHDEGVSKFENNELDVHFTEASSDFIIRMDDTGENFTLISNQRPHSIVPHATVYQARWLNCVEAGSFINTHKPIFSQMRPGVVYDMENGIRVYINPTASNQTLTLYLEVSMKDDLHGKEKLETFLKSIDPMRIYCKEDGIGVKSYRPGRRKIK